MVIFSDEERRPVIVYSPMNRYLNMNVVLFSTKVNFEELGNHESHHVTCFLTKSTFKLCSSFESISTHLNVLRSWQELTLKKCNVK